MTNKATVAMNEQNLEDSYPLSPLQEGMLFHDLYAPHTGMYLQQLVCTFHEILNVFAFKEAWKRVLSRHSILRTSFHWEGFNEPIQRVHRHVNLRWIEEDCRELTVWEQDHRVETYLQNDRQQGFQITEAPLMRLALFQMGDAEFRFIWTSHHAIQDGRSRFILLNEVFSYYEAFCRGKDMKLQHPRPYRDYIDWLTKEDFSKAEDFWRRMLKGVYAHTPFVVDSMSHGLPDKAWDRYEKQEARLSDNLTRALQSLAKQHGVSPNTILQGAWALLLSRYSGEQDVVFGATRACRRSGIKGAESMVGLFINTLPLKVSVSPDSQLLPWLKELRSKWIAMRDYEHTPLIKIEKWSDMPPGAPLFESILSFENYDLTSAMQSRGADWVNREFRLLGLTNFPIAVNGYLGSELLIEIVYNRSRFEDNTIARMLGHIEILLESIIANPEQRLSNVRMLREPERKQILLDWNATSSNYPRDRCVHQLFEQQVEQTPDAVAVVHGDEQWTYRELNARANRLAHYLKGLGVGPEVLVGICLERSPEMVLAVLAILKAGGAYVPLDPDYPQERLAFMLADTGIAVLLTDQALLGGLPQTAACLVCLDRDREAIGQESDENPLGDAVAQNLAYVMYTSGSTGRPKGVCVTHRNVARLVKATNYARFGAEEVFLQFAPISFDASTLELWGPLLNGGRLVVFPPATPSLAQLAEVIERHRVTTLWLTASLFHQLVEHHLDSLGSVRQLLAGGDVLSVAHVRRVLEQLDGCCLINGYGPTENTTFTACHPMRDASAVGGSVPIGRPIANTRVYLLDARLQPVPIGVAGELYAGGDGVARGYWNRPGLTAEKFIADPFSDDPAARLYKTGDLARYLPDGTIEFLGRLDHQVKIRGFRIELGEIESVLGRHPGLAAAVVIAREDVPGDKRLVAYVVARHEPAPTITELRSALKETLPDYMIPSAFVYLDALPLTPNGKVDRRALPAPDVIRPDLPEVFLAPRSQSEELVAGIWSDVLGLERIGVHDSFFELGGHSLLMVRIASRIREVFGVELSVRTLFEVPTVAGLSERIEAVSKRDEGLQTAPLQAVPRDKDLPLSFAQERLWFLHHFEPSSVAYSIPRSIRLKGVLRKDALEKAYVELARRHETLRTTFHSTQGQPVLRIAAEPGIVFDTVDLRHLPEIEREAEVKRLREEDSRKPFDLAQGPLFRIRLFQLEDREHVLHSNMHHIISDHWSFGVMTREITALYTAFINDKPALLADLPLQYADYAVWQRQWLKGEALEAQLDYWKDKLGGELPVLELPTDRPRPAVQTHRGAIEPLALPKKLTDALQSMSRREGVTLFMTLLAAFKTLLYRLTGQVDIIVGTPIAGRNRTELEGMIGLFINTIVLRTDLSGRPTFRELLGRVKETALGAYAHHELPFEKLVDELSPERDLSRTALFQVFFNHIFTTADKGVQLPGLETEVLDGLDRESKFDMTLVVLEGESGIQLHLLYNTDLFDSWRVGAILKQYEMLLESIVFDPEQRISKLSLLTEAERHQILVDWNATRKDYDSENTLVRLFEEQVESSSDAIAVVYEGRNLTYRELNKRANQLAHYIGSLGVGPEKNVGLCLERSFEMVIGILGILKAGGAYVPLDPDYPRDRLVYMLRDAQVSVLLTTEAILNDFPDYAGNSVCLDKDWLDIAGVREGNINKRIMPDNSAYVIYTSGSTGKPKGVVITHSAICNHMLWRQQAFPLTREDCFLQKASLSFDISVWEVFAPLLTGGRLILSRPGGQMDSAYLAELVVRQEVTAIHFSPTALQQFLEEKATEVCSSLKWVFCGGEAMSADLKRKFFTRLNAELIHQYGPTETTVDVASWKCRAEVDHNVVPIGRPIADTKFYILDANLEPLPVGVQGELYVGGAGLARGYLNRPELTAEQFIPDPFSYAPDSRLYRTGDLVRLRNDATIEFLGRTDFQVKLRGFRIELGEIESALGQHPEVEGSVVLLREDEPGEKRLVAYVLSAREALSPSELRQHLKQTLPEYMVPATFMKLDALPLTPNGKVDRQALPDPDGSWTDLIENFVPPRNPVEELLVQIWENLLRVKQVGVHDNFFELGGHSLLATQVISRVRESFHLDVPLRQLFEGPTIDALGKFIEHTQRAGQTSTALPLVPCSRTEHLPLSFAQQRLWFLEQLEPGSTAYSMPYAVRLRGALDVQVLARSLNELVKRHESLRTVFAQGIDEPIQVILPSLELPVPLVDLQPLPAAEREAEMQRLSSREAQTPFELAVGPLIRAQVVRMGIDDHVVLLNLHHIISDGWSMGVLFKELEICYQSYLEGQAPVLPPLPVQYADYAAWQRQWLQGEPLHQQMAFWEEYLAGIPELLELPTDSPRPAVQQHRGAAVPIAVDRECTAGLRQLAKGSGCTLFMVLEAAFAVLLWRFSGCRDIVIGTPVASRPRRELEDLIGLFLNTLVLRTRIRDEDSFAELLAHVRHSTLEAYAHQDIPFELLVERLNPKRSLSHHPVFQVMLNQFNVGRSALTLPGVQIEQRGQGDRGLAKFDLNLGVAETPGGLSGRLDYDTSLFRRETVVFLGQCLKTLLQQAAASPARPLSELSLLSDAWWREVAESQARQPSPAVAHRSFGKAEVTLVERFLAQVERYPHDLAVVASDRRWTYRQLDERARQLAAALLAGPPAEPWSALLLPHDAAMVVGILGSLMAGRAYLPLDAAHPDARLRLILADTQARTLVCNGPTRDRAQALMPPQTVLIDLDRLDCAPAAELPSIDPDAPAYLLFTSGSTGRPKGVMQTHKNVLHFIRQYSDHLRISHQDRLLQLANYTFDGGVVDCFSTLLNGATLCPFDMRQNSPKACIEWIDRERITVYHSVPTVFRELVKVLDRPLETVRLVVLGGEPVMRRDFLAWRDRFSADCFFVNFYGQTETSVNSVQIFDQTEIERERVAMGFPVEETALILAAPGSDANAELFGEIVIQSPYLAAGYWQPDSDAFAATGKRNGQQRYRTGDLARRLPDGSLEFLDRLDHQVKIRGFRIELGEIESVLRADPGVSEVVVIAREDRQDDRRLVAYVVLDQHRPAAIDALRRALAEQLPAYMIPNAFVSLDALPRKANGKVDRLALPAPELDRSAAGTDYVAPGTPLEEALAEIWREVLTLNEPPGIHDDFFELGGHSLLAVQVVTRIETRVGATLDLRSFFLAPTVGALAALLGVRRAPRTRSRPAGEEFEV